ncbi:unnamed protein product [Cochlearia groenlandica]
MPTPVNTARQCLTEETARALDDAVSVARTRSHSQTTSLHAVSGLLTMPSSILRGICISRAAHSTPYSSHLQFRALELCVGVSLDRLPSSKSPEKDTEVDPPVSNSLMAAIKRSQATQRRHPETYQIHGEANQTTSVLKVELKYFLLSILDDPIVSRVFGEAGFRSTDVKLDVLHPSRFARSRRPPLFLRNFQESDLGRARFGFNGEYDENSRRIGEVLRRKDKRNPLLVGISGEEALKSFRDSINRGKFGFLPTEISGLCVVSVEKEIREILVDELERIVEQNWSRSRSGMVLNLGELSVLTSEDDHLLCNDIVSKLTDLLKLHNEKLWLIASVKSNEMYLKVIERFPEIDKDLNLHLIPITSSSQSVYPKSSLMGSFVPFGGFFSSTSDFRVPFSSSLMNQALSRCHLCNEKYEQEVSAFGKSSSSLDLCSVKLPCWLRNVEYGKDNGILRKVKDDPSALAALQKKWDDICQRIHQTPAFPKLSFQPIRPQFPLQLVSSKQAMMSLGSPTEQCVGIKRPESFQGMAQVSTPPHQSGLSVRILKPKHTEDLASRTTNSPLTCVTTDLGLGTIYESRNQESTTPVSLHRRDFELNKDKLLLAGSPYCKDFKSLRESLSRKVGLQNEAVSSISEIICGYRDNMSKRRSHSVWLALLGPDRVGKKKVALALAEVLFGGQDKCIRVDFQAQDRLDDRFRGKTVVDYVASEVAKRAESVVLIENVEKAEFLDQTRLSEAVRTGKLRDSHGREISMKNAIVVVTSYGIDKDSECHVLEEPVKYSEENVLNEKNRKLKLKLADNANNKNGLNKRRQEMSETEKTELRAFKSQRSCLDLNLPVDEREANAISENTEAWLEEFVQLVDGKVAFKVIDFDGLAKNIKRKILSHFHRYFGHETHLEIENDAILQILAALRWSLDEEKSFDHWLQNVVSSSFVQARQKYVSSSPFVVKLVASKDSLVASKDSTADEEIAGINFPTIVEVT